MVEATPIKLSYTIYPGEKFFDGQLVAVEENRLVFRTVTKIGNGKFVVIGGEQAAEAILDKGPDRRHGAGPGWRTANRKQLPQFSRNGANRPLLRPSRVNDRFAAWTK